MTAATHPVDDQPRMDDAGRPAGAPLSGEPANDGPSADWPAGDWVAEATSGGAEYELYLDENTGLYEIRRVGGEAQAPEEPVHTAADGPVEVSAPVNDASEETLAGWACLPGSTGPSAFHTPMLWALSLTGAADFSPVPALGESRGGSAWPLEAAA